MIVKVTQDDIDKGTRQACEYCPVAIAALRAVNEYVQGQIAVTVSVTTTTLVVRNAMGKRLYLGNLPFEVRNRIMNFDDHGRMDPFEFEIDA